MSLIYYRLLAHKAQQTDLLSADKTRTHISLALNMYKVSVMAARRVHTNLHTHTHTLAYTSESGNVGGSGGGWPSDDGRRETIAHEMCAFACLGRLTEHTNTRTHAQIKQ